MLPFSLPDSPSYAVAFSGGADSRLLLELTVRALLERFGEDGRKRVIALHLHHGIRGEEADRDEAFCRAVCAALRVELVCERTDIPALAKASGESMETAARKARYDFFARSMAKRHIQVLLTAHHADDNLETVLERLLRGSGTRGMGGIPACREWRAAADGVTRTVCRPLLSRTRREILAACAELSLDYVTDSTNLGCDCTRNRIRHTVVPALEAVAGTGIPQRTAARMSAAAAEDDACLTGLAMAQLNACLSPEGNALLLEALQGCHPAISKRMAVILYERATAEADPHDGSGTLSAAHLEALCDLIGKGIPESSVTLPRSMEARIRNGCLYIRPAGKNDTKHFPNIPIPLTEGTASVGSGFAVALEYSDTRLSPKEGCDVYASAVFPADIPRPLLARRRRDGDILLSHGMHKRLKKLLNEKGIPPHLRDRIPLICLPDGSPLWYPRAAFRDGYPAPISGPCLRVTVFITPESTSHEI
ncbi:MAG: tRNA lysidine(34) synthetase TilS [Clostridia bacterium]|nr:tRNA lysidine(34) synthetase TilS [Clostridia bacterium]